MSIEWAAGLFEGEGSISLARSRNRIYPRLVLASTDEDVVRRFHETIGVGYVNGPYKQANRPHTKPTWRWEAFGTSARKALPLLLPFLGERRTARANEVLAISDGVA